MSETDAIVPNAADGIAHGTYAGHQRHGFLGVPVCDACRAAAAAYQRNRRSAQPAARSADGYWNRTRHMALERLAREYPQRFAEILAEIRESVQAG
jgi:hypothetical protein